MKRIAFILTFVLAVTAVTVGSAAPFPYHVLFVGAEKDPRTGEYVDFLRKHFRSVRVADREAFNREGIDEVDVVILDWPQGGPRRAEFSPLGPRAEWSKPTVLLGSAGLNLAIAWKMVGGSG